MKTRADIRNSLGDDLSWKSLYAVQQGIYPSREEAIVDCLRWVSNVDPEKIAKLLLKHV